LSVLPKILPFWLVVANKKDSFCCWCCVTSGRMVWY
jgi:hypothetical protein